MVWFNEKKKIPSNFKINDLHALRLNLIVFLPGLGKEGFFQAPEHDKIHQNLWEERDLGFKGVTGAKFDLNLKL
ncbi:MAG: hypothetical protein CM15mP72_0070 [Pelagibacteraceae bacterium]|nr:MAG: hypothetical protein CM15mP72_0070 [Pelagibacteraceae bacterium]